MHNFVGRNEELYRQDMTVRNSCSRRSWICRVIDGTIILLHMRKVIYLEMFPILRKLSLQVRELITPGRLSSD
jgi:hypothetical protein